MLSALRRITPKKAAPLKSQPAEDITADSAVYAKTKAPGINAPASEAEAKKNLFAVVKADFIAYNRAAVNYIINIFIRRLSTLISGAGAIVKRIAAVKLTRLSKMDGAPAADNFTLNSESDICTEVKVSHTSSEDITASDTVSAAVLSEVDHAPAETFEITAEEKTDCGAEFAYWIYPEETEDGGLIIRQVYFAKEIDDGLEVE